MNFKFLIIIVLLAISGWSNSAIANDFEVALCDSCISTTNFRNAALATGHTYKDVVVINLYTKKSMAFRITKPFNTYDFIEYIKPINVPEGTTEAINEYHLLNQQLRNAYEWIGKFGGNGNPNATQSNNDISTDYVYSKKSITAQMSNSDLIQAQGSCTPNGCGSPSSWTYHLIPNSPFLDACNQHDVCYCSGQSKGFCDQQFLNNMRLEIEKIQKIMKMLMGIGTGISHLNKKVTDVLLTKLLYEQAEIYYMAVHTSATAKKAYCDSSNNTNAIECRPAPSGQVEDRQRESSTGSYIYNGREVVYRCTTFDVYTKQTGEYSGSYTICSFA